MSKDANLCVSLFKKSSSAILVGRHMAKKWNFIPQTFNDICIENAIKELIKPVKCHEWLCVSVFSE